MIVWSGVKEGTRVVSLTLTAVRKEITGSSQTRALITKCYARAGMTIYKLEKDMPRLSSIIYENIFV